MAGGAAAPASIPAAPVDAAVYAGLDRQQLEVARENVAARLTEAFARQTTARHDDTICVLTMGLPLASLNGADQSDELGRLKGEGIAITDALISEHCVMNTAAPAG